jgi:hypothetical protein
MAWWIVIAFAIVLLLMAMVYRTSLRAQRRLTNYALLLLLNDEVLEKHRADLSEFVRSVDAKGAGDLGLQVYKATTKLAVSMSDNSLGVAGLLWKLRTGATAGERQP